MSINIANCYEIEKGVKVTETINKVWYGMTFVKNGKLKYHAFEFFGIGCTIPGYINRLFNIAIDRNKFDENIILGKEIEKYSEGFLNGYTQLKREVTNNPIIFKDSVFNTIKYFPYGERPVITVQNRKLAFRNIYAYGERVGRFYCAWCIVLMNQNTFESMFNKWIKNSTLTTAKNFESLFKDPTNAQEVKKILEIKGYTKDGKWVGLHSGLKTELLIAYYTLIPIIKQGKPTPQATIFYNEFGLPVPGYISKRSLTTDPRNGNNAYEFEKIFALLLPKL